MKPFDSLPDMTDEAIALDDLPDATKHARLISIRARCFCDNCNLQRAPKLTRRERKKYKRAAQECRQETLRRLANGRFITREQHDTRVMKERLPKLAESYFRSVRRKKGPRTRESIAGVRVLPAPSRWNWLESLRRRFRAWGKS